MADWRSVKKIDAHIHIIPDEVLRANPDSEDVWSYADLEKYRHIMAKYNIEKAVIMPLNDPWLLSMDFTVSAVHQNLAEMKQKIPNALYAFTDIDVRNSAPKSIEEIQRAIKEYHLDGIKIHPNNGNMELDSAYYAEIFRFAQMCHIPVAIHSYPNTVNDFCSAKRIVAVLKKYPELTVIVSHMGAFQWEELVGTSAFVDISAILPAYADRYGIKETNSLLRKFGVDRLIFATDYPDSRTLEPEAIYETYFDILNQMDFTDEEIEKIACKNIQTLLDR